MQANNIVEVNIQNFQQVILEGSQEKPVIVEFWASGHEPSEQTSALLQQLISHYGEQLTLARIDCAKEQQIAMQFGVQALPTIAVFKEGQGVDGLVGPQTEETLKELLEKFLPKEHEQLFTQGKELLEQGDVNAALPLLMKSHDLAPDSAEIRLTLSDAAIQAGRLELGEELLNSIGLADQNSYYQNLCSALEIKQQAADSPELRVLQEQVNAEPENHNAKLKLAAQLQEVGKAEEALALLFDVLKRELNALDGELKKGFLDLLAMQPDGDPLARSYRGKLYGLMN